MKKLCWALGVVILLLGWASIAQGRKIDGLNHELTMARFKIREQQSGLSSMREAIYQLQQPRGMAWTPAPVDRSAEVMNELRKQQSALDAIEYQMRIQTINAPLASAPHVHDDYR